MLGYTILQLDYTLGSGGLMVDNGIFATTTEVQRKAGANASAVSNVEAYINDYMTQAESLINVMSQFNWTDAYTGLNVDVKGILKSAASAKAAMFVINYDMSGFTSRAEAQTMLDVLKDEFLEAVSVLRDIKKRDFTNAA